MIIEGKGEIRRGVFRGLDGNAYWKESAAYRAFLVTFPSGARKVVVAPYEDLVRESLFKYAPAHEAGVRIEEIEGAPVRIVPMFEDMPHSASFDGWPVPQPPNKKPLEGDFTLTVKGRDA